MDGSQLTEVLFFSEMISFYWGLRDSIRRTESDIIQTWGELGEVIRVQSLWRRIETLQSQCRSRRLTCQEQKIIGTLVVLTQTSNILLFRDWLSHVLIRHQPHVSVCQLPRLCPPPKWWKYVWTLLGWIRLNRLINCFWKLCTKLAASQRRRRGGIITKTATMFYISTWTRLALLIKHPLKSVKDVSSFQV